MTSRERFITALNGGTPDRVPVFEHLFSPLLQKEVLGYNTDLYDGKAQVALANKLGIDGIWTPINGFCGLEETPHKEDEVYVDEWGVTYRKNGWPIMAQLDVPIKSREDWEKYKMPEVNTPYRTKILRDVNSCNTENLAVVLGLLGPFTMSSWYLTDFENLSIFMYTDPELVHQMNEAYLKWALEAVALAVKDGQIDAVQISDDWGGTSGLLISPDDFRTFIIPYFSRLVAGIKAHGLPVIMHNDGQIWDVLDDIAATGISGLHPVERAAGMDLVRVKEHFKGKITPIGNINNKVTMCSENVADVEAETLECIKTAAKDGGYIVSSDHSIHNGVPFENTYCMIATVKKYGVYPIGL